MNDFHDRFQVGTKECGLLFGGLGALLALCLILFGFWGTMLIAALFAAGYFLGACDHKKEKFKGLINRIFPPKGE